jgi:hypothetical protein
MDTAKRRSSHPPWGLPLGKHRNVPPRASGIENSAAHASDFFLFNPADPRVSEDDDSPNLAFDVDVVRVGGAGFEETLLSLQVDRIAG